MTTGQQAQTPGLPLRGTAFVHFALDIIDLLKQATPGGLDKDGFLMAYFRGSPPTNPVDQDAWWNEFKRAVQYSCRCFNQGAPLWAWIRARPGRTRGQYFYIIEAQCDNNGRILVEADAANAELLDDFTDRRWRTQTQSRQRVRAVRALSLIHEGTTQNDPRLVSRGEGLLREFITLSPGLAAINFGSGILMEDLERLARSNHPHIRLLNRQIQNALRSGRRLEKDLGDLVAIVLVLADIYQQGSLTALP